MTLSSRHRIRNSNPGGLRPSTLPLGHGGSPQYWLSHVDGEETFFVSLKPPRPGTEPRTLAWKAAVLTTTLGPPPTQRSVKTHCRQWVCGHCDCLGISLIFRLTTFDGSIRRQKSPNSANRVFTSPSIRGISEKQSFLFYFQLGIISWKKNKKKRYWAYVAVVLKITLSILVTCLVSSNCSVTHVRWGEGTSSVLFQWRPHFKRSGDVETVLFQCITLITFGIPDQTSPNFQGSRRNGCEWCVQNYM